MPDDHDVLIRLEERIKQIAADNAAIFKAVKDLQADVVKLQLSKAQLVGWCAGVSAVVGIVVKVFWK